MKRLRNNHLEAEIPLPSQVSPCAPRLPGPPPGCFGTCGNLVKALGPSRTTMQKRPHFLFTLGRVHRLPTHAGTILPAEGRCPGAEAPDPAEPATQSASCSGGHCRSRWTGLVWAVGGAGTLRSVRDKPRGGVVGVSVLTPMSSNYWWGWGHVSQALGACCDLLSAVTSGCPRLLCVWGSAGGEGRRQSEVSRTTEQCRAEMGLGRGGGTPDPEPAGRRWLLAGSWLRGRGELGATEGPALLGVSWFPWWGRRPRAASAVQSSPASLEVALPRPRALGTPRVSATGPLCSSQDRTRALLQPVFSGRQPQASRQAGPALPSWEGPSVPPVCKTTSSHPSGKEGAASV